MSYDIMAGDHEGSGSQPLRLLTSEHKPIANTNTYISVSILVIKVQSDILPKNQGYHQSILSSCNCPGFFGSPDIAGQAPLTQLIQPDCTLFKTCVQVK